MQLPEITKIPASEIVIDPELSKLFPRYSETAFAGLEQDLLRDGFLAPLILWDKTLIDGHNRFKIIEKHNLDFYVIQKEFSSRDDVKIWMIRLVIDQRNLTPEQLSYYRGMHYLADKRIVGNPNFSVDRNGSLLAQVGQVAPDGSTATRLAEEYTDWTTPAASRHPLRREGGFFLPCPPRARGGCRPQTAGVVSPGFRNRLTYVKSQLTIVNLILVLTA